MAFFRQADRECVFGVMQRYCFVALDLQSQYANALILPVKLALRRRDSQNIARFCEIWR
jgi:hypothetical protein